LTDVQYFQASIDYIQTSFAGVHNYDRIFMSADRQTCVEQLVLTS